MVNLPAFVQLATRPEEWLRGLTYQVHIRKTAKASNWLCSTTRDRIAMGQLRSIHSFFPTCQSPILLLKIILKLFFLQERDADTFQNNQVTTKPRTWLDNRIGPLSSEWTPDEICLVCCSKRACPGGYFLHRGCGRSWHCYLKLAKLQMFSPWMSYRLPTEWMMWTITYNNVFNLPFP